MSALYGTCPAPWRDGVHEAYFERGVFSCRACGATEPARPDALKYAVEQVRATFGRRLIGMTIQPGEVMFIVVATEDECAVATEVFSNLAPAVASIRFEQAHRCLEHSDCRDHPELGRACWEASQ